MYQNYVHGGYSGGGSGDFPYGNSGSSSSQSPVSSNSLSSRMNEAAACALLQHLSKDELQQFLDDDSKLQDLINDLDQVKGIKQDHDALVATNKSLAEYNLSLQPRIADLIQHIATEYGTVNSLKTELGQHKATLDTFVGQQSLDTLHALLQTETAKSEEDAEELAEKFCSQELDVEAFMAEFLPKRTLAHLRRIKSERMGELVRQGGSIASAAPQRPVPPPRPVPPTQQAYQQPHHPPYPSSAAPPYPTAAFGMPQPQPNLYSGH